MAQRATYTEAEARALRNELRDAFDASSRVVSIDELAEDMARSQGGSVEHYKRVLVSWSKAV